MTKWIVLALMGSAVTAAASNTGFKLRLALPFTQGGVNAFWLSLPYRYFPSGNVGQTPQNSLDLCRDLNSRQPAEKVATVSRFLTSLEVARTQSCFSTLKSFDLAPGEGYIVRALKSGVTIELIGAHDDSYAPNKHATPTLVPLFFREGSSNNNLVSVPYHVKARNSLDLCAELNASGNRIYSIVKLDTARQVPRTQTCAGQFKAFDLGPGEAYSIKPVGPGISIGFEVW